MSKSPRSLVRIFRPEPADGFEFFMPLDPFAFNIFSEHVGYPLKDEWKPIEVVRHMVDEHGAALRSADFPYCPAHGAIVMRSSAAQKMSEIWSKHGELLPLLCSDVDLFAFHPLVTVEALDEELSSIVRFDDGRILAVTDYVFRPEKIIDADIFQTLQMPASIFVNHRFASIVERAGLSGLEFTPLWSSQQ